MKDGDYCAHCKMVVYDFTERSNEEIRQALASGVVCGKFYADQLQVHPSGSFRRKAIAAGVAAFLSFGAGEIRAQSTADHLTVQTEPGNSSSAVAENENSKTDIAAGVVTPDPELKPSKKAKPEPKRKRLFRIGSRTFYITNQFPFLQSRRILKGRLKW